MAATSGGESASTAAALANALFNGEAVAKVVALSFDLSCEDELYDALAQAATARRIELERTNADTFPELSISVELALQHLNVVKHANEVATEANATLQVLVATQKNQQAALLEARASAEECVEQLRANSEAKSWIKLAMFALQTSSPPAAVECLQQLESKAHLRKEALAVQLYSFAATRIAEISRNVDAGLVAWATMAIEIDGQLGAQVLSSGGLSPETLASVSIDAVDVFLQVNKRLGTFESALERYRDTRLPALAHARRGALAHRNLTGLCEAVQRITGFFTLESRERANCFSRGELGELWADTVEDIHRSLEIALNGDAFGEGMVNLFRLVAAMPLKSARLLNTLIAHRTVLAQALVYGARTLALKNDAPLAPSHDLFASGIRLGFAPSSDIDGALPISSVVVLTLDMCVQVWRDALALQRRFGAFDASMENVEAASLELALQCASIVNERLGKEPDALHVAGTAFALASSLGSALSKVGAATADDPRCSAIFEATLAEAKQRIKTNVRAMVSQVMSGYNAREWAPPFNDATVLAPSPQVFAAMDQLVKLFSSPAMRHLHASVVVELRSDATSALEDALFAPLHLGPVNPVGVHTMLLDVDVVRDWALLPRLGAVLRLFSVDGALDSYCKQTTRAELDLVLKALGSFVELDASSRLFAPADKKAKLLDLRATNVKRAIALLKSG